MAKGVTFQFEDDLDYQIQAINSTIDLFKGLSRRVDRIYKPVRRVERIRKFDEGDPVRKHSFIYNGNTPKEIS